MEHVISVDGVHVCGLIPAELVLGLIPAFAEAPFQFREPFFSLLGCSVADPGTESGIGLGVEEPF